MKKWTMPLAAALAAVLVAVSQAARPGDGGDLHARFARLLHCHAGEEHGIEAHLDAAAAMLELSPDQRKEVGAVLAEALPGLEARALELVEAHAKQFELLHAAQLDEEALRAASARAGIVQGDLAVAVARLIHNVHRVLLPEQLERLAHLHHPDLQGSLAEHVRGFGRSARAWAARQ